uniref:Uncharacterized protein n=1 Tax=Timema poppense TaxID=170557 RepID=A0A7R9CM06_TIMPO|nr:unnamed protein product [Timema poppensis]
MLGAVTVDGRGSFLVRCTEGVATKTRHCDVTLPVKLHLLPSVCDPHAPQRRQEELAAASPAKSRETFSRAEKRRVKVRTLIKTSRTARRRKSRQVVRGYLVRKKKKAERDAAVKIQAGFRGYKTRRQVKLNKNDTANN